MPDRSHLYKHVDLLADPVAPRRLQPAPAGRSTVEFAPFHGEHRHAGVGIADDNLELGADHLVEELRALGRRGAGASAADVRLVNHRVRDGLDLVGVPGERDQHVRADAPHPVELTDLELQAAQPEHLVEDDALAHDANGGAVFGRGVVDVIGGGDAAGRRHVLRHDHRLPGKMLADVPGHEPAVEIDPAPRAGPDDQVDGLAFEVRQLREALTDWEATYQRDRAHQPTADGFHGRTPVPMKAELYTTAPYTGTLACAAHSVTRRC